MKFVDRDGKQIRAVSSAVKLRRAYNAYKIARAVEGVGFWGAVGAALTTNQMLSTDQASQARDNIMQGVNSIAEKDTGTQELNKNHAPDPGYTRGKQNEAKETEFKQSQVGQAGGHNPKDSGGDFEPNNPRPSPLLKVVAVVTTTAILIEQCKGGNDARDPRNPIQRSQFEEERAEEVAERIRKANAGNGTQP